MRPAAAAPSTGAQLNRVRRTPTARAAPAEHPPDQADAAGHPHPPDASCHAADRAVVVDRCFAIECQGRLGSPGRALGPPGRTEGPGMAAERRCRGRGPVPDAAGEGSEEMGVSYYDTLLPVRECGAGLRSVVAGL